LSRVLNSEIVAPSSIVPDLPTSFDRIVLRGLERNPAERYATAKEMANDLGSVIGVASSTEIGEWVGRNAADELRERAETIAAIERAAADAGDLGREGTPFGHGSPGRSGTREVGSNVWLDATKSEVETRASVISSVASGTATAPWFRSRRRVALLVGAGACVPALAVALFLFLRNQPAKQATHANEKASVAAPKSESVPAPAVNVEDLPQAPGSAPMLEIELDASSAPAPATHAKGSAPVRTRPPAHSENDCNPPYTMDSVGHIHFKPSCL
jgi:serine/threonine-protein kinase